METKFYKTPKEFTQPIIERYFDFYLYRDPENDNYFAELWGSSTKHPDSTFNFNDWPDKFEYLPNKLLVFQWLLWIASQMINPHTTYCLTQIALEYYDMVEQNKI